MIIILGGRFLHTTTLSLYHYGFTLIYAHFHIQMFQVALRPFIQWLAVVPQPQASMSISITYNYNIISPRHVRTPLRN
jgi:hypothetical protein